jgi:hypothetical protein
MSQSVSEQLVNLTNPFVQPVEQPLMNGTNLIKCNNSKSVSRFIKSKVNYVIELTETNTIVNVTCTGVGLRACDMYINSVTVNGVEDKSSATCTISYRYEDYDTIYYSSFSLKEKCNLYISVKDIVH